MARTKLRVTGFTRFILVMIIVVPLAYLGASYYNGEDGIGNIKRWLGIDQATTEQVEEGQTNPVPPPPPTRDNDANDLTQQQLEYYKRRVEDLEAENNRLQQRIWEQEQEISRLQESQ
jgi:cell division protein FtsB